MRTSPQQVSCITAFQAAPKGVFHSLTFKTMNLQIEDIFSNLTDNNFVSEVS